MPDGRPADDLSRRERQIMDIVYRLGRATAAEVHAALPNAPHAAAVRTHIRILEEKGHLQHEKDGPRHVYFPATSKVTAQRSAVRHLLRTFFDGSRSAAIAALIDETERPLSAEERSELDTVVRRLKREGR